MEQLSNDFGAPHCTDHQQELVKALQRADRQNIITFTQERFIRQNFIPPNRVSDSLPYLTQPPSRHQTLAVSLENEKFKLHLYHTHNKRFIKYGIVSE